MEFILLAQRLDEINILLNTCYVSADYFRKNIIPIFPVFLETFVRLFEDEQNRSGGVMELWLKNIVKNVDFRGFC